MYYKYAALFQNQLNIHLNENIGIKKEAAKTCNLTKI